MTTLVFAADVPTYGMSAAFRVHITKTNCNENENENEKGNEFN